MDTSTTAGNVGEFDAAWRESGERLPALVRVVYGLIGLSRLGEYPVEVDRFAVYLDRSVDDALEMLGEQSGALFTTRVVDGLITVDLDRPVAMRRRCVRVGDRRIAMSGCAPDLFLIAAVLDRPFQVEDTCPATGVPIRVDFTTPDRRGDLIDGVDPAGTVVGLDPRLVGLTTTMTPEQIDANLCVQMPFFASAGAAGSWLADHPARQACPVRELAQSEIVGYVRDVLRPRVDAHSSFS